MIHLHRAERADRLLDALAEVVAPGFADPFTAEVVAVPTRGIERWLAQELSTRLGASDAGGDGVCANIRFPFPGAVVGEVLGAVSGVPAVEDPWSPPRLVWPLLDVVDEAIEEPWLAPLRAHLIGSGDEAALRRNRRYGAVRHIADLFDRYGVHRPDMLLAWAEKRDVDGAGAPLPEGFAWQARLWRRLGARLEVPAPALRLREAVARLLADDVVLDLPERVSVFGLTALPATFLQVLEALATSRAVHLFLLHPSPALWAKVDRALTGSATISPSRDDDPTRRLAANALLGSWGRDAREMQLVLARGEQPQHVVHLGADTTSTGQLLHHLQADVRGDVDPADASDTPFTLAPDDRSVQVHACHGKTRQVEVLRDAILHLLAADPTLEPRDVVIMCPDIEAYAPIVDAVFSARSARHPDGIPDLRVRLADRALRQTNPVLRVIADLLEIAAGRLTATEVLDLAGRAPVRCRFRFDDEDLTRLEQWVADAQVRWGLDADHRARFGLDGLDANTWRAGLDRMLLGLAMADEEERVVGGAVPLDDVEGLGAEAVGRFAELVDRLGDVVALLHVPRDITSWRDVLVEAADLLTATVERDRWQRVQLGRVLDDVVDEATSGDTPSSAVLTLAELRALLEERLRGRPTRANHRTGDLTVCTLVPMRSVPHRVVCLLGMDDTAFPRRVIPDGDDLVERAPHVGDRDTRTEDRQLLLDALLAAGDALVVTYSGFDVRTGERRPPAVPVGELLDVIDRSAVTDAGGSARRAIARSHPLQPFDTRSFDAEDPWSFDPVALEAAEAGVAPAEPTRFLPDPLPPLHDDPIDLDDLVTFLCQPVRAFLRRRLDVSLPRSSEEPADEIPIEVIGLDRWHVGDRLLRARLVGVPVGRWSAAEHARGTLPPGALATPVIDDVTATVDALVRVADEELSVHGGCLAAPPETLEVDIVLPGGRRLVGAVGSIRGDAILNLSYSRVAAKHRIAGWARLLAASAAAPQRPWCGLTVGRCAGSGKKNPVGVARIDPLGGDAGERRRFALDELARLVDLYDRGLREPLPLYCASSEAYARSVLDGDDVAKACEEARRSWEEGLGPERIEAEHVVVLGGVTAFDSLLAELPSAGEDSDGWDLHERTRFGRLALRLWSALEGHEDRFDCGEPE